MDVHRGCLRLGNWARSRWHLLADKGPAGSPPFLSETRASFEKALLFFLEPVVERYFDADSGCVRRNFIVIESESRRESDSLELVARTFVGASYYLSHRISERLERVYAALIRTGVDPRSPHAWGNIVSDQVAVENTSLVIGLLLTRDKIWGRFSEGEKRLFLDHLEKTVSQKRFRDNNWLWFKVFHFLFLEQKSERDHAEDISPLLERLSEFYAGDGWYRDGVQEGENRFDYYNAWAMHYYGLLFCMLAPGRYENWKKIFKERFLSFKQDLFLFVRPDALPVPFGRSLIYRFAVLSPWGLAASLGLLGAEEMSRARRLAAGTLNSFFKQPIVDAEKRLTLGYTRFSPLIVQSYSGSGSPYWALKAFSFLLMDDAHPFWAKETPPAGPEDGTGEKFISPVGILIRNSSDGHVCFLNGGLSSRLYPAEYNKFCYSNRFWPVLAGRAQDHQFAFPEGGRLYRKDVLGRTAYRGGCLQVEWGVSALAGLSASSTLMLLERGYLLVTRFRGAAGRRFVFYGFSVPAAALKSGALFSRVSAIGDRPSTAGRSLVPAGRVLSGEASVVPFLRSVVSEKAPLILLVEAGPGPEPGAAQVRLDGASVVLEEPSGRRIFRPSGDYYERAA